MFACVVSKNENGKWESREYTELEYKELKVIPENVGYISIIGYIAIVTSEFAKEFNLREREQFSEEDYFSSCYIECTSREVFNELAEKLKVMGNGDCWAAEIELLTNIRLLTLECKAIHKEKDGVRVRDYYFIK